MAKTRAAMHRSPRRMLTAVFDDAESARKAISNMAQVGAALGHRPTFDEFVELFTGGVSTYGGDVLNIPRSTSRRETRVYGYQERIHPRDLNYLASRDPTAFMLLDKPSLDTWCRLPRAFDPMWDAWLQRLANLGLPQAARAADFCAGRDGGGFLYINAGGNVGEPLSRGDRWFGFDYIPLSSLAAPTKKAGEAVTYPTDLEEAIIYDETGDPLLMQHGIQYLTFFETQRDREQGRSTTVHGSRIVSFARDPTSRHFMGASDLEVNFDDLWNLRDIVYALKRAQLGGNPIVIEIDAEQFDFDDEKAEEAESEFAEFEDGHLQAFSPLYGATMKRVGASNLDDAENIITLLASRISNSKHIPFNMVISTSKGSVKVEDGDYIAWESYIEKRRAVFAEPILAQLAWAASASGELRQRPNLPDFPIGRLRWPHLRKLNQKDEMLATKNMATTIKTSLQAGRVPPAWVDEQFPLNLVPVDPALVLPNPPKAEDQDPDGGDETDDGPTFPPNFPPEE